MDKLEITISHNIKQHTVKPVKNDHPYETPKYWQLLIGGRCSDFIYVVKSYMGPQNGGIYRKVVTIRRR